MLRPPLYVKPFEDHEFSVCQPSFVTTLWLYIFHIVNPKLGYASELAVTVYPLLDAEVNATVGKRSDGGGDGGCGGEGGEGGGGGGGGGAIQPLRSVLHVAGFTE